MRVTPGFKGPMTPAASPRAASVSGTRTAPAMGVGMTPASGTRTAPAMGVGMAGPKPVVGTRMKKGGSVSSASKRADGCAVKGKTKGKMV